MLSDPVLVLNQNYQPLNVCRVRRAIVMLLQGRAELIENNSSPVRSAGFSITSPSVVRIDHHIRYRRPQVKLTRQRVFIRDGFMCLYCGTKSRELTLDHVTPRHKGGTHTWDNIVSACKRCNQRKAGRTPTEAGMQLLKKPFKPTNINQYVTYSHVSPSEWSKYLTWAHRS